MRLIDIDFVEKENNMNNIEKEAIKNLCYHINGSYALVWDYIDEESIYIHNIFNKEIICKAKVYKTVYPPTNVSYCLYFCNEKYRNIANELKDPNLLAVTAGDGYKFNLPNYIVKFVEKVVNRANNVVDRIERAKGKPITMNDLPTIRAVDVIFNDPATIIVWADGSKTVVKAENEPFDPEKGLAMAISKKILGNKYDYYDIFKKYVGRYEKKQKKGKK